MAMSVIQYERLTKWGWQFLGHVDYGPSWESVAEHMDSLRADKRFEFEMHEPLPGKYIGNSNCYSVWKKERAARTTNVHE